MSEKMAWTTKGSGVEVNRKAILIALVVVALLAYYFFPFGSKHSTTGGSVLMFKNWDTKAFTAIPQEILDKQKDVQVLERRVTFEFEKQQFTVFMYEALPPVRTSDIELLLLHGSGDSGEIWKSRVKTLQMGAAMGYRTVALDLPGWGNSDKDKAISDKADFIAQFIRHRGMNRPIIVAPSMSGSYAIPFIIGTTPSTCMDRVRGFIPIAPVGTDQYEHAQYHRCETPTMIVYGTEDKHLGLLSVGNLRNMANSVIKPMEKQGHACYINKPDEWHHLLYNFLLGVVRENN